MADRLDIYIEALGIACEELASRSRHLNGAPCPDGMSRSHADCILRNQDEPPMSEADACPRCWWRTLKTIAGLRSCQHNPDLPPSEDCR